MLLDRCCYFITDSKLTDQLESLKKEITRLDYQKNELEKVRVDMLYSVALLLLSMELFISRLWRSWKKMVE